MGWFKLNKTLRKELKRKTEEADNIRTDWFRQRKEISDLGTRVRISS